ncbi:hypothetical protein D3C87_1280780 [compost metagenome]
MFDAAHARNDHVQVVHGGRVYLGQRTGQEVRLLLVVAFEHHAVARGGHGFEEGDDVVGGNHLAIGQPGAKALAAALLSAAGVPLAGGGGIWHRGSGHAA